MSRSNTITQKVPTPFGSLYVHLSHDDEGRVIDVAYSSPGKFDNSAVGDALILLGQSTSEVITTINEAFQPAE